MRRTKLAREITWIGIQHSEDRIENANDYKTFLFGFVCQGSYVSKGDDKLYFIVRLRPGGGIIPQAVGLQGPDVVAHNNTRRGDRGNTC